MLHCEFGKNGGDRLARGTGGVSPEEFRLVAIGWGGLIIFLTLFWYATLNKLSGLLKERLKASGSSQEISGVGSVFRFLIRGSFKQTGDERLVALCMKLRKLLYGYMGATAAYVVFLVIMRSKH
jgi:hypothetical protein